ncbi:hypothetical protein D9T14_09640 [Propionibacterium australiense]|nr:hypothetical protein D7U36_11335 [Propionibacterium australiense]RLP07871.1 hypothetical protein D9T14_09640 [Propionibacterium australiense]
MVLPLLLTIVLYMLPGMLALLALGARGVRAVYPAPMISTALVATLAVVYGKAGIGFSPASILLGVLVCIGLFWALRLLINLPARRTGRSVPDQDSRDGHPPLRTLVMAYVTGFVICLIIWVFDFARPMRGPENFPQPYDVPFHFSVIKYILDSQNGSTLTSAMVDRTAGSTLYPAAWHDMIALVVQGTGVSIPVAVAASSTAILVLVWPLGVLGLTCELFGHTPRWVALSLGFSGLFATFPYRFVIYGVLYSNFLSYALLPAFIALFVRALTHLGAPPREHVTRAVVLLVGLVGIGLAQPNSAFTIVVLGLPFLVQQFFHWCGTKWQGLRRIVMASGLSALLVAVVGVCWGVLFKHPALQRTVTFEWPPFQSAAQAVRAYATSAPNDGGQQGQYLLAAVVLVGIVAAVRNSRLVWLVGSWVLMGFFYVVTTSSRSTFRNVLTGFWYHDSNRLIAAGPMMAIPLAALGLVKACEWCWGRLRHAQPGLVPHLIALLVVVVLTCVGAGQSSQREILQKESELNQNTPFQDDEYAFLEQVAEIVPEGVEVANFPYDGSAYAYPLFDVNVYFKDYEANWIGHPTQDIKTVQGHLSEAATNEQVCRVLDKYNVQYYLSMESNGINGGPLTPVFIGYDPANWKGYDIDESTPGFEPVLSDDEGNTLYRITACQQ